MNTIFRQLRNAVLIITLWTGLNPAANALAQQNFDEVQIDTIPVTDDIFMLVGSGGNLGVSVGEDGAFLIDDQYAPLTDKIAAAIKAQSSKGVQFVVNTHWHGDHTGGNENWGESGAIIVAHENVRARLTVDQFIAVFDSATPASPEVALPVVTFTESVTFHWNGDEIHVFHVDPAHTDGDAIVFFKESNVIHAGDTFFNGMYPFIDTSTGGSFNGMIKAAEHMLEISDADTKIIPGHGALADRNELAQYHEMLLVVRDAVAAEMKNGRTRNEVINAHPTAALDDTWGQGFLPPEVFVGIAFDAIAADRK